MIGYDKSLKAVQSLTLTCDAHQACSFPLRATQSCVIGRPTKYARNLTLFFSYLIAKLSSKPRLRYVNLADWDCYNCRVLAACEEWQRMSSEDRLNTLLRVLCFRWRDLDDSVWPLRRMDLGKVVEDRMVEIHSSLCRPDVAPGPRSNGS